MNAKLVVVVSFARRPAGGQQMDTHQRRKNCFGRRTVSIVWPKPRANFVAGRIHMVVSRLEDHLLGRRRRRKLGISLGTGNAKMCPFMQRRYRPF